MKARVGVKSESGIPTIGRGDALRIMKTAVLEYFLQCGNTTDGMTNSSQAGVRLLF